MGTRRRVACLLLCICAGGCRPDRDAILAGRGEVDASAPLVVHLQLAINAPPARVWLLLADIRRWPDWQPDIRAVAIAAPPAPGVRFSWSTASGSIRSRIAAFDPGRRLGWTGQLFWIRAIHVWTLAATSSGGTIVSCDESLRGWGIGWLMRPVELAGTDHRWLSALKQAAERTDRASRDGHRHDPARPY